MRGPQQFTPSLCYHLTTSEDKLEHVKVGRELDRRKAVGADELCKVPPPFFSPETCLSLHIIAHRGCFTIAITVVYFDCC